MSDIIADVIKDRAMPRCAVLLAAYNGVAFIDEQIKSILAQKHVEVTIFISVDLSSDLTYDKCLGWSYADARVITLSYGKSYGSAAKNFFRLVHDVDVSSFDYVSFSDQDDIWLEEKLIRSVDLMVETGSDGFSSDVIAFWESGRKEIIEKSQGQTDFDFIFEAGAPGCTYLVSVTSYLEFRNYILSNPAANNFWMHDWLMYAFYRSNSYDWHISKTPLVLYRQHRNNVVGFNKGLPAYLSRIQKVRDKRYRSHVVELLGLLRPLPGFSLSRFFLIRNFLKLRRRKRDAYVLLFFILVGWF